MTRWHERFWNWFLGTKHKDEFRHPQHPDAPSADADEAIYEKAPEMELRSAQQHRFLFDEGVLHWNRHRHENDFKPNFAGTNFIKEAAKTRLWGRPHDLQGAERLMLAGIDWRHANLHSANLSKADLRDAKLQGANLQKAILSGANLSGADLTDCDLRGANLDTAILARAKLVHANLSGASLKGANLSWSNVRHMVADAKNLQDALMVGTYEQHADLNHPHVTEPVLNIGAAPVQSSPNGLRL